MTLFFIQFSYKDNCDIKIFYPNLGRKKVLG